MTIKKHIAVALFTFASLAPVSSTVAQSTDPFEVFPESCASRAREQMEEDRARAQPSVSYAFYDLFCLPRPQKKGPGFHPAPFP